MLMIKYFYRHKFFSIGISFFINIIYYEIEHYIRSKMINCILSAKKRRLITKKYKQIE